ncbi:MAG TPA: fumarylacetoacetase [Rubricoccaceae bacterium]|jgi:fumarylacetoacetase
MTSFLDADPALGFGLNNLPYGCFSRTASPDDLPSVGVRLGEYVIDLHLLNEHEVLDVPGLHYALTDTTLNRFMAAGKPVWDAVRARLQDLLSADGDPALREDADLRARVVVPLADVTMHVPALIGDYTDFYSSRQHATNVGIMFRGADNALMPNWLHLPVGYHGRASSVVVSGTPVVRPCGQTRPDDAAPPVFGPSRQLDIELELGVFVGPGNALGEPVAIADARDHIFGYVLVNDWSARDLQKWEYVPLGPFLAKSFCTSVSPWVVPAVALDPFRIPGEAQDATAGNPEPLPYLRQAEPRALDVQLDVRLDTAAMRASGADAVTVARSNAKHLYWSPEQQLAHHTVAGCNLRPGDLLASGTISGETDDSFGSFLEITWRGTRPVTLPSGEERRFLEDGDRVVIEGAAEAGGVRVGFGTVEGTVTPARAV